MESITFESFPKIARLSREVVVTEKLDGTNAQVIVTDDGQVGAASRNRLIVPGDDNAGFAKWVEENKDELKKLGPGRHFGEWWGGGIGKRYPGVRKRFSLFRTDLWTMGQMQEQDGTAKTIAPLCCDVVPVLWQGIFDTQKIDDIVESLRVGGSVAAPGFSSEGVVVFHTASGALFKKTTDKDEAWKGLDRIA